MVNNVRVPARDNNRGSGFAGGLRSYAGGRSKDYNTPSDGAKIRNGLQSTLSGGSPGNNIEKWLPFFGHPHKAPDERPLQRRLRHVQDLPEAFHGQNYYLEEILVTYIENADRWPIAEMCPWKTWDNSFKIVWDRWLFTNHMLERVPEQAQGRLLNSYRESGEESMVRYGISLLLERGFADTPDGAETYRNNLLQIATATVETFCHGAMIAVMDSTKGNTSGVSKRLVRDAPFEDDEDVDEDMTPQALQDDMAFWGCVNRRPHGLEWALDELRKQLLDRVKKEPNFFVVPNGAMRLAKAKHRPENFFFMSGMTTQPNPESRQVNGKTVHESRGFRIGEGIKDSDPCFMRRTIGGFMHMFDTHLRTPIEDGTYKTEMMDIAAYNETNDKMSMLRYRELLLKSGVFKLHPSGTKWDLGKLGPQFFGDDTCIGEYLQRVDRLENMKKAIKKLGADQFNDFFARFVSEGNHTEADLEKFPRQPGSTAAEFGDDARNLKRPQSFRHSLIWDMLLSEEKGQTFSQSTDFRGGDDGIGALHDKLISRRTRAVASSGARPSSSGMLGSIPTAEVNIDALRSPLASVLDVVPDCPERWAEQVARGDLRRAFATIPVDTRPSDQFNKLALSLRTSAPATPNTTYTVRWRLDQKVRDEKTGVRYTVPDVDAQWWRVATDTTEMITSSADSQTLAGRGVSTEVHATMVVPGVPYRINSEQETKDPLFFWNMPETERMDPEAALRIVEQHLWLLPKFGRGKQNAKEREMWAKSLGYMKTLITRGVFAPTLASMQAHPMCYPFKEAVIQLRTHMLSVEAFDAVDWKGMWASVVATGTAACRAVTKEAVDPLLAGGGDEEKEEDDVEDEEEAGPATGGGNSLRLERMLESEANRGTDEALKQTFNRVGIENFVREARRYAPKVTALCGAQIGRIWRYRVRANPLLLQHVELLRILVLLETAYTDKSGAYDVDDNDLKVDREGAVKMFLDQLYICKFGDLAEALRSTIGNELNRRPKSGGNLKDDLRAFVALDSNYTQIVWDTAKHLQTQASVQRTLHGHAFYEGLEESIRHQFDEWKVKQGSSRRRYDDEDGMNQDEDDDPMWRLTGATKRALKRSAAAASGGGGGGRDDDEPPRKTLQSETTLRDIEEWLYGIPILDGEFFRFVCDNNLPPLVGLLLMRPHQTYDMGSIVGLRGFGETGWTFNGHADFMLGENVNQKTIYGNFTMYGKTVILHRELIVFARDAYCRAYIRGNGVKVYDPENMTEVAHFHRGTLRRDIFVVAVPINEPLATNEKLTLDLTGFLHPDLGGPREGYGTDETPQYSTARIYSEHWHFNTPSNPLSRPLYSMEEQRPITNTLMRQDHQGMYDYVTKHYDLIISNCGAWGPCYEGVGQARVGRTDFKDPNYRKLAVTSIRM